MADHSQGRFGRSRLGWGLFCIALGCYPIAIALGLLPVDEARLMAPMWVVALAGLMFVIGGAMILTGEQSWANDVLAGILSLLFGIVFTWISFFGSSAGFSGGVPLLSDDSNVTLGRWIFGIGALMCFAVSVYAFRRAAQSSR